MNVKKIRIVQKQKNEDELLREILEAEWRKRGGTQTDFASKLGISAAYLNEILKNKKSGQRMAMQFFSRLNIVPDIEKDVYGREPDFVHVKKFTTPVSGGPGNIVCSNETDREYSFRRDWLASRCPSNECALFDVTGDSMSPVIADGDVVLVDMSKNTRDDIVDGKIYAFTEGNRIVIKKLEWRGSGLWAVPLNAQEYQIDETNHFGLIGRVIWVGHELK